MSFGFKGLMEDHKLQTPAGLHEETVLRNTYEPQMGVMQTTWKT
jgi:hypothetical protein